MGLCGNGEFFFQVIKLEKTEEILDLVYVLIEIVRGSKLLAICTDLQVRMFDFASTTLRRSLMI